MNRLVSVSNGILIEVEKRSDAKPSATFLFGSLSNEADNISLAKRMGNSNATSGFGQIVPITLICLDSRP